MSAIYGLGTVMGFANHACEHLPDGWVLELHLEKGAGGFELTKPNGKNVDQEDYGSVDYTLLVNGLHAVEYARKYEGMEGMEGSAAPDSE